jgi:hypothetical protein
MSVGYRIRSCGAGRREPPRRFNWSFSWSGISSGTGRCDPQSRLSFFSSRRNWDSPNPSPAGECAPPPPGSGGVEGHARGWVTPYSDKGTYTVVLLIYTYFVMRPHIPVPRDTTSFSHTFLPKTPAIFLYIICRGFVVLSLLLLASSTPGCRARFSNPEPTFRPAGVLTS